MTMKTTALEYMQQFHTAEKNTNTCFRHALQIKILSTAKPHYNDTTRDFREVGMLDSSLILQKGKLLLDAWFYFTDQDF